MKQFLLLITLSISILLSSCKRDYPSDIPRWLKNRILEFKRKGKSGDINACGECPLVIEQCTETTTKATLYRFYDCDPGRYDYFDADGNEVCYIKISGCACPCGMFNLKNIDFTRRIWTAKGCN